MVKQMFGVAYTKHKNSWLQGSDLQTQQQGPLSVLSEIVHGNQAIINNWLTNDWAQPCEG